MHCSGSSPTWIRERTNKHRLEDALGGALDAGGSIAVWWPPEKVIEAADAAIAVPVLRGLYDRFGKAYLSGVYLAALWARLGGSSHLKGAISRGPRPWS